MKQQKIVGVGLNKTGTSTLKRIMKDFGYRHCTWDIDMFNLYQNNQMNKLHDVINKNDSFENWPWALMYSQFDEWYPQSKFILTIRKDADTWYKSLCNHYDRIGELTDYEIYIYGYANPYDNKQDHIDYYHNHNEKVRNLFKDRPHQLLELCIDDPLKWQPLCDFIGEQVPSIPFPHENKTPTFFDNSYRKVRPILGKYKQAIFGSKK